MKSHRRPINRCLSRYRYWRRKLADLEKNFDAFCRAHHADEFARIEYSKVANVKYFEIKARLEKIKSEYWMIRGFGCGLR